jgi:hypothetical protein
MHCEEKLKWRSHDTSYCLIELVTKTGLTVIYIFVGFYNTQVPYQMIINSNMTGVTSREGIAYPSSAPALAPNFWMSVNLPVWERLKDIQTRKTL